MLVLLAPALVWTVLSLARGVAALAVHGIWTTWLLYGVPLLIIITAKGFVSYKSRTAILNELSRRQEEGIK